jgi:hypothetical protein
VKLEGLLCIGGIVRGRGPALGYSCVDRGKVCEVNVDFYDEVAIR